YMIRSQYLVSLPDFTERRAGSEVLTRSIFGRDLRECQVHDLGRDLRRNHGDAVYLRENDVAWSNFDATAGDGDVVRDRLCAPGNAKRTGAGRKEWKPKLQHFSGVA